MSATYEFDDLVSYVVVLVTDEPPPPPSVVVRIVVVDCDMVMASAADAGFERR